MRGKNPSIIFIPVLSMLLASEAQALEIIKSKYPFQEIDGDKTAGSASPLIAAHLMGAWGMATSPNEALALYNATHTNTIEDEMLALCQAKSVNTSWPELCSPAGMVLAMTERFKPFLQKWSVLTFAGTKQTLAVSNQMSAMRSYQSPVLVPIYGHVDHWIAIREMRVKDLPLKEIIDLDYFDAGTEGFLDQDDKPYLLGKTTISGAVYSGTYYTVVPADNLDAADPYIGKFLFSYDPPEGTRLPQNLPPARFSRGVPVVGPGEMTEDLAPMLVWDALEEQGLLADPDNAALWAASAGDAWTVQGTWPSGQAWDYIQVPMYDEEMRHVIAFVGLSASDGAFEQLQFLDKPRALDLPDAGEATRRAKGLLKVGEQLRGGALAWDPACGEAHCRQPLRPYREFTVVARDGVDAGRVVVPMGGQAARRIR